MMVDLISAWYRNRTKHVNFQIRCSVPESGFFHPTIDYLYRHLFDYKRKRFHHSPALIAVNTDFLRRALWRTRSSVAALFLISSRTCFSAVVRVCPTHLANSPADTARL